MGKVIPLKREFKVPPGFDSYESYINYLEKEKEAHEIETKKIRGEVSQLFRGFLVLVGFSLFRATCGRRRK